MSADPLLELSERLTIRAEGPRPLTREITDQEPYPVEHLGTLRDAVLAISEHTRAPPGISAHSVLAALSLVLQGHVDVVLPTGASCPVSLFLISIAETGARKSAVDRLALRPVHDFEEQLRITNRADQEKFAVEKELWEAARAEAIGGLRKAKKSIKAEGDLRTLGDAPQQPLTPLLTCPEPTFEGYCQLTASGYPALGLFSDEGGAFIGGFGMSADNRLKTAASLSALWGGDPIKRVRAGDGTIILSGRRLALHLMVQPGVADELLADELLVSQGLVSRILVTAPPSAAGTRFFQHPSDQAKLALERYHLRLAELLAVALPLAEGTQNELTPRRLRMSDDAELIWINLHDFIEERLAEDHEFGPISGFANKAPEHAARIAGLLTLWLDLDAEEISAATMASAAVVVQHYLAEMLRLRGLAMTTQHLKLAQRVLDWVLERWPEPAIYPAAIYNDCTVTSVRNKKTAMSIIKTLEEHGWLTQLSDGATVKGTRRKQAWLIHGRST